MTTNSVAQAHDFLTQLPDREIQRTARQMNLPGFGPRQQARLHASHALIVGAGGLGCPALQQLAAAGVGKITLLDDDTVDLSNIHRQILFGAGDVGKPKVEVAAARARELQPDIQVIALAERIRVDNVLQLFDGVDLVLDGSDTFATKYLVADACEILGIPLVWGTVLQYSGEVALWHSGPDVQEKQRDGSQQAKQRGVGLRDLFPEQPDATSAPDCATAGVLGVTTSVIAGLMSTEAIAYLTEMRYEPGRVLRYQAMPAALTSFRVRTDPQRPLTTQLAEFYGASCAATATEPKRLSDQNGQKDHDTQARKLLQRMAAGTAVALDVREAHEKYLADLPEHYQPLRLPLSTITSSADIETTIGSATEVVVFCASGLRSQRVIDEYGPALPQVQLWSLPGGLNALGTDHRKP